MTTNKMKELVNKTNGGIAKVWKTHASNLEYSTCESNKDAVNKMQSYDHKIRIAG